MQLPAKIGKYELEEFLGGGMSHVYRARDTVIGRTVAVKILTDAGCEDAEAKARFLAEARMAGNLSHDNILGIYDFGEDEQHRPFMVMEFLRGEDLRHAITDGHTGDLQGKLKIALQIARALGYIHTQKIIHRDIKPDNVHINTAGVVKLMDFGIAKTEGLQMTRAGFVLGTPYYMAPEQVTGANITGQVDVYAFGILLFELLTGAKPISGDTVERIFYQILNEPLNLDPLHQARVPQSVCDLVAKCTAKNPADRPQGFGPVCQELDRVLVEQELPTAIMPEMQPEMQAVVPASPAKARPGWLLPVVVVLVALLAAAGVYFAMRPKSRPAGPALAKSITTPTGEMVLVPMGTFLFGKDKNQVDLPAFYIDKTEVTNAAYAAFCQATGHPLPVHFKPDKRTYPVVEVSFLDAQAFARWAGKRLPTAREWEKAARGADGRDYPWGNEGENQPASQPGNPADASRANLNSEGPWAADAMPNGASPNGALNMVGNVWELVDQSNPPGAKTEQFQTMDPPPGPNDLWYTIRGGGFNGPPLAPDLIWDDTAVPARWKAMNLGFRCVRDAQAAK
ncbi:MAG TPA: bifunctional serine/threonine-protein kinase/formylglycine-generating enzyme family protein [Candidatus Acidoferrales bacterium]|jgi:formylglycine-generating enzyme required for sulfatase activity|nr:bifunctional serine/threonine-protein kinase/formylglycine-generating enzyme family protein [Candidatus Acidoferrales bacterium]